MTKTLAGFRFISTLFVLFILALASSCSFTKGKEQGERAVEQFHKQFNAGQYKEIYQSGSKEFKEAVTEDDFVEFLEAVKRKLGTVDDATESGWRVNAFTTGTLIILSYEVKFSEGKGTEQFQWLSNGDEAKLLRYDVNSPVLITK